MLKITIKAARVNAGLSQKEAAEALKISNKTLCSWENGISVPNIQQVDEICALYDIPYDNLNFLPKKPLKAV